MNREAYYQAHHEARFAARNLSLRDKAPRSASRCNEHRGVLFGIYATRDNGRPIEPARVAVRILGERAWRGKAASALTWAATYRVAARKAWNDSLRQSNIRAARACIAEARAYYTGFAALPV